MNGEGQQQEDDVDQYFDDGGETFLPADHVSDSYTRRIALFFFELEVNREIECRC